MKLCFKESRIEYWASRYQYAQDETALMELEPVTELDKGTLLRVCYWKSPRNLWPKKNTDSYVREVTRFAFSTTDERARIEALTLLDGVSFPTASAVLHLFHQNPYPGVNKRI